MSLLLLTIYMAVIIQELLRTTRSAEERRAALQVLENLVYSGRVLRSATPLPPLQLGEQPQPPQEYTRPISPEHPRPNTEQVGPWVLDLHLICGILASYRYCTIVESPSD